MRASDTLVMSVDINRLIETLQSKRNAEGLSLRKLSAKIGVSFSTLARIERGDGEPDNNSLLRILDWLGVDGEEAGLKFENVALVHFRASKNVSSQTTKFLLEAAHVLKKGNFSSFQNDEKFNVDASESAGPTLSLSKPDMEEIALELRTDLGLNDNDKLEALALKIKGVSTVVPQDVSGLSEDCVRYLTEEGADDWSAMSVPLSFAENNWTIFRNDRHSLERQRVTYLEECWHILLGHKLTKVAKIGTAYGRTYENSEEHDAFYLATASLLPEKAVRNAVERGETAEIIGAHFGTSMELVEYRIKRMGLWREYKSISIELS